MKFQRLRRFTTFYPLTTSVESLANPKGFNASILLVPSSCTDAPRLIQDIRKKLNVDVTGAIVDSVGNGKCAYSLTLLNGTPFYSQKGRAYKKTVGRWPDAKMYPKQDGFSTVSQGPSYTPDVIPSGLENANPNAFITLSDAEPIELYQYLNHAFPNSLKVYNFSCRWASLVHEHPSSMANHIHSSTMTKCTTLAQSAFVLMDPRLILSRGMMDSWLKATY